MVANAGEHQLTILLSSDTHASFNMESASGFLDLIALSKNQSTILIDNGDTIAGALSAEISHGQAGIEFLNQASYTVWVPGNRDFEFGTSRLIELSRKFKGDLLLAGMNLADETFRFNGWKTYHINNLNVAVIGYSPHGPRGLENRDTPSFFASALDDVLEQLIPEIEKSGADLIVLVIHYGWKSLKKGNVIHDAIKKYPQIKVICGAHTHEMIINKELFPGTIFIQGDKFGSGIVKLQLTYDDIRMKIVKSQSQFLSNPGHGRSIPCIKWRKIFADANEFGQKKAGKLIWPSGMNIETARTLDEGQTLLQLAAQKAVVADVALISITTAMYTIGTDCMSENDLFRFLPRHEELVTFVLDKSSAVKLLNESAHLFANNIPHVLYAGKLASWPENKTVKIVIDDFTLGLMKFDRRISVWTILWKKGQRQYTKITMRCALRNFLQK